MITITRRFQYAIGHRVHGHESKCRNMHGHNYVFHFTATAEHLDTLGRIIDFSILKTRLGEWLEGRWDHGFLVYEKDDEACAALRSITGQKKHVVPFNPTAENMASYLLREICPSLLADTGVTVIEVRIEETENCTASATRIQ